MISLFQITDFISRVIAFVRGLFSQILDAVRGIFQVSGAGSEITSQQTQQIETQAIETTTENTATITPFGIVISVIVVILAIFATIQYQQYRYEREQKDEALQGHFLHVESRGNVQKNGSNEDEKEGAEGEREKE